MLKYGQDVHAGHCILDSDLVRVASDDASQFL
jgi:hypothetical protein